MVRLQERLSLIEELLRGRSLELTAEQREARERSLDLLHAYWTKGDFPKNRDHPGYRVPIFIDDEGTPCAAAAIMIGSGHGALARWIQAEMNHAFLDDIDLPGVKAWVASSGLTLAELKLIQPTYSPAMNCRSDVKHAIRKNDVKKLKAQIQGGRPDEKERVLACAAEMNELPAVKTLLKLGATPRHVNTEFWNAETFTFMLKNGYEASPSEIRDFYIKKGSPRQALDALKRANPTASSREEDSFRMLALAISRGDGAIPMIEALLAAGVDAGARSPDGRTALHVAIIWGRMDEYRVLERALQPLDKDLTASLLETAFRTRAAWSLERDFESPDDRATAALIRKLGVIIKHLGGDPTKTPRLVFKNGTEVLVWDEAVDDAGEPSEAPPPKDETTSLPASPSEQPALSSEGAPAAADENPRADSPSSDCGCDAVTEAPSGGAAAALVLALVARYRRRRSRVASSGPRDTQP